MSKNYDKTKREGRHNLLVYGYSVFEHRAIKSMAAANGLSLSKFLEKCITLGYKQVVGRSLQEDAQNYSKQERERILEEVKE